MIRVTLSTCKMVKRHYKKEISWTYKYDRNLNGMRKTIKLKAHIRRSYCRVRACACDGRSHHSSHLHKRHTGFKSLAQQLDSWAVGLSRLHLILSLSAIDPRVSLYVFIATMFRISWGKTNHPSKKKLPVLI